MSLGNNIFESEVSSFLPLLLLFCFSAIYPLMIELELQLAAIWPGLVLV